MGLWVGDGMVTGDGIGVFSSSFSSYVSLIVGSWKGVMGAGTMGWWWQGKRWCGVRFIRLVKKKKEKEYNENRDKWLKRNKENIIL